MEKKLTLQDIINNFCSVKNLPKKKGDLFVKTLFETISEGLIKDGFVKIKGFGTFKIIIVNNRESIDVNSGERINIDSHPRITFVPDNTFKSLVNKPFESFESIPINDEETEEKLSSIDETIILPDSATPTSLEKTEESLIPQTDKTESLPPAENNDKSSPIPSSLPENTINKEQIIECFSKTIANEISKQIIHYIASEVEKKQQPIKNEKPKRPRKKIKFIALIVFYILSVTISCLAGIFIYKQYFGTIEEAQTFTEKPIEIQEVPKTKPQIKTQPVDSDSIPVEKAPIVKKESYSTLKRYTPTGLKTIVTLQKGENIAKIAERIYGSKDFAKYIIEYNKFKDPNVIHIGDKIKVPELKAI